MSDNDADRAGYQEQVARLAADVAARLAAEPQSEITAHLARLAARQAPDPGPALEAARQELQSSPGIPADIGERRGRAGLAEALAHLADEVAAHRRAMESLMTALADSFRPATHRHPDVEGELDALHDRFAAAERNRAWTPTDLDQATRLEALERACHEAHPAAVVLGATPPALAAEREVLAASLRDVVTAVDEPLVGVGDTAAAVLADLGRSVVGHGVDAVAASEPGALGGVVVTEADHLAPGALGDLVAAAARSLRPGGRLVVTAADASSLHAHRGVLHLDLERRSTLHPMVLETSCAAAGFVAFELHGGEPDGDSGSPAAGAGGAKVRSEDVLDGPQHFLAVARR